jgi:hypothetical protein
MRHHLPRRHRTVLAVTLFLVAAVAGTWVSTLVGDEYPTPWGVAAGLVTGAALVLLVLSPGREGAPARR